MASVLPRLRVGVSMSEFEFLAVMMSIIFGLALTHVLSGTMQALFKREYDQARLVWSAFACLIMVLNWWTFFAWNDHDYWSFDIFLALIIWAVGHYVLANSLYPPGYTDRLRFSDIRWRVHSAFIFTVVMDIVVTAIRGDLFKPWFYLPYVGVYALISGISIPARSERFQIVVAWCFLIVMLFWSLLVRKFLA